MALAAAPEVPGFQALSPLGYGPTSTIYSAQSTTLGRWVALTVYSASLPDERSQKRFRRAFDVTRRLGIHPAAVTMLDCGLTADRHAYVATEIYERGTLEGRAQGRPVPVDDVLRIGIVLAGALETAHRAEVIHGGVHPGRVLLGNDGEPALADLGLVALVERGGLAALTGPVSLYYHASPEVLEGEDVTPASDVFSLASTLYTALAGRSPYQRDSDDDTPASLLLRILQHDIAPIGRPDVPPSLEDALRRALSCSPRDRPGRALAFARELQACQQELGQRATEPAVMHVAAGLELAVADSGEVPGTPAPGPGTPGPGPADRPAPPPPASSSPSSASVFPEPPGPPSAPTGGPASVFANPSDADLGRSQPRDDSLPQVAPPPSSNGTSPVQRVFIPYPAPEPPDPLHRDEKDGPAVSGSPAEAGSPGEAAGTPGEPAPGAVVPLFPPGDRPGNAGRDDRPPPPAPTAVPQPSARPDPPIPLGLPPFQPDGPSVPPDLGAGLEPPAAPSGGAPAPAGPAAWPEHPGASDPSEHHDGRDWLRIPVGDENDPAAGAPPWPGPPANGSHSGNGTAARGDVDPDGFVWPDDSKAPGREGLGMPAAPRQNGNGLSAGIGGGWPDTPRRGGAAPAEPNRDEWPYVADRPARGAASEPAPALAAVPLHTGHGATHPGAAEREPEPSSWAPTTLPGDDDAAHAPSAGPEAAAPAAPTDPDPDAGVARALPVIAVGVIVAVLTLGVAWVVMFGEDPGESANRSTTSAPPPDELRGDTTGGEDVTAVENPTGVQLDWGATDGPQVVVVLSDSQPPRTLPAKTGSALMVPSSSLDPDVGYCFAVVPETDPLPTPAELAADLPDSAIPPGACIRGATAATVLRQ